MACSCRVLSNDAGELASGAAIARPPTQAVVDFGTGVPTKAPIVPFAPTVSSGNSTMDFVLDNSNNNELNLDDATEKADDDITRLDIGDGKGWFAHDPKLGRVKFLTDCLPSELRYYWWR
jgi:hypothetical protein